MLILRYVGKNRRIIEYGAQGSNRELHGGLAPCHGERQGLRAVEEAVGVPARPDEGERVLVQSAAAVPTADFLAVDVQNEKAGGGLAAPHFYGHVVLLD